MKNKKGYIKSKEKGNIYRSLEDYNKNYNLIDRYNKNNGVTILKHLKEKNKE